MALTICVILVVLAFGGLAASSYFRAHATRNLLASQLDFQLSRIAQAAVFEVATSRAMTAAYQGADQARLAAACRRGPLRGGYLFLSDAGVELEPTRTRGIVEGFPGLAVTAVTATPLYYLPGLRYGVVRFQVGVEAGGRGRAIEKQTAVDFEFTLRDEDGKLVVEMADAPVEVVSQ